MLQCMLLTIVCFTALTTSYKIDQQRENKLYHVDGQTRTFDDAKEYCTQHGHQLLRIESQSEQDWILDTLKVEPPFWLDVVKISDVYVWSNKMAIIWNKWRSGHPSSCSGTCHAYVAGGESIPIVNRHGYITGHEQVPKGSWKAESSADKKYSVICEEVLHHPAPNSSTFFKLANGRQLDSGILTGRFGVKLFYMPLRYLTRMEAELYCALQHDQVARVANMEEQSWLKTNMAEGSRFWQGAHFEQSSNASRPRVSWTDVDVTWTNWNTDEPRCVSNCSVVIDKDNKWITKPYNSTLALKTICERDLIESLEDRVSELANVVNQVAKRPTVTLHPLNSLQTKPISSRITNDVSHLKDKQEKFEKFHFAVEAKLGRLENRFSSLLTALSSSQLDTVNISFLALAEKLSTEGAARNVTPEVAANCSNTVLNFLIFVLIVLQIGSQSEQEWILNILKVEPPFWLDVVKIGDVYVWPNKMAILWNKWSSGHPASCSGACHVYVAEAESIPILHRHGYGVTGYTQVAKGSWKAENSADKKSSVICEELSPVSARDNSPSSSSSYFKLSNGRQPVSGTLTGQLGVKLYYMPLEYMTSGEAEDYCALQHDHVARAANIEEQSWLQTNMAEGSRFWRGVRRHQSSNASESNWLNEGEVTWTNWNTGEPSCTSNCSIVVDKDNKWITKPSNSTLAIKTICERNQIESLDSRLSQLAAAVDQLGGLPAISIPVPTSPPTQAIPSHITNDVSALKQKQQQFERFHILVETKLSRLENRFSSLLTAINSSQLDNKNTSFFALAEKQSTDGAAVAETPEVTANYSNVVLNFLIFVLIVLQVIAITKLYYCNKENSFSVPQANRLSASEDTESFGMASRC
ncbi:hypothetical protein HDE_10774 [Halotydeus destructor]|nr:hypothetical protein HDE_10774 [Halotydeus destructor]